MYKTYETEMDIEEMEYLDSLQNAKEYNIPEVGDVVTVKFLRGEETFIVIRTQFAVNYVMGEEVKSPRPVYVTGWDYKKSIKHQCSFHVSQIIDIKRRPKEYADLNFIDDWQQHVNKIIESQIPKIGRTAIIRKDSIINIFERRFERDVEGNRPKRAKMKYKIVDVVERDISPLLILKPTKHFNQEKFEELYIGHCWIT